MLGGYSGSMSGPSAVPIFSQDGLPFFRVQVVDFQKTCIGWLSTWSQVAGCMLMTIKAFKEGAVAMSEAFVHVPTDEGNRFKTRAHETIFWPNLLMDGPRVPVIWFAFERGFVLLQQHCVSMRAFFRKQ